MPGMYLKKCYDINYEITFNEINDVDNVQIYHLIIKIVSWKLLRFLLLTTVIFILEKLPLFLWWYFSVSGLLTWILAEVWPAVDNWHENLAAL